MAEILGQCCGSILTQIQYSICNVQHLADTKTFFSYAPSAQYDRGALPVEDYPIANSAPANRTHTVDGAANTNQEGEQLPAYNAMPQMSAGASAMEAKRVEQPSTLS
ncbi:uncharacterized protein MEPE_04956 [Melanopsichium pennsylvanicum]|uniref:Uncharacterized protein n=1 Tax=Melanopsichium pennsylvanicum TaxID=63383 RepID=A0AAJ4XQX0_9BASI|nr:uncharacterized protein MEPE_04956 [Melanopsichium pennsylvanicum]